MNLSIFPREEFSHQFCPPHFPRLLVFYLSMSTRIEAYVPDTIQTRIWFHSEPKLDPITKD